MSHPSIPLFLLAALATRMPAQEGPAKDWSHHMGKVPFIVGYEAGIAQAVERDKPVMLFITATWCGPCKRLASESFADEGIAAALQAFVPVIVDGDAEPEILELYEVEGYPDVRFQTTEGAELGRVSGYVPKERFSRAIASALGNLDELSPVAGIVFDAPGQAKGLQVGVTVPAVTLRTVEGEPFDLRAAVRTMPTVLVFYRGGWCPFCNRHLADLRTIEDDLRELGYQLLAVSPDVPRDAARSASDHRLGYTLLSDTDHVAARRFKLAFRLDPATAEAYEDYGFDLSAQQWTLPVPAAFVIDGEGRIAFAHVDPDYKRRLAAADLLDAARRVLSTGDRDRVDR